MKELYKESLRSANTLFHNCEGNLLIFLLLCYAIKKYIFFPILNQLWALVLSTLPSQFITERNAIVLLKYPYVPVAGLILIILFCMATVWELAAIMLCLEYYRQEKRIKLWKLMVLAGKNIRQLIYPKNWLFFVYILIIMPLTDLYSASGMLSSFSIPEYISDFILASPILTILQAVGLLFLAYLAIRWFYVMPGVLIQGKSVREARADSVKMMRKRTIHQLFATALYNIEYAIHICIIPVILSFLVFVITMLILPEVNTLEPAFYFVIFKLFLPMFIMIVGNYLRMAFMCYLVSNYRIVADELDICKEPVLPDLTENTAPMRSFRWLRCTIFVSVILLADALFASFTIGFYLFPETMEYLESDTQILAHKGYSSKAPENTLDAFDKACDSDTVDMIELDIRESKDGIPIVIHNSTLKSACGVNKSVYDLTYDEIKSYTASYGMSKTTYADTYIPTLEEVLEKYGSTMPLLIEIKDSPKTPDLPQKIVDLLNKYDCKENCMIHSGSYEALEKVKAIDDTIPCGYIIAMGTGSYYNLPCADFFSVEHTFVNQYMLNKVHSLGKKVYAWTVNEDSSIDAMAALDVDGVITDYPDNVHEVGYSINDIADTCLQSLLPNTDNDIEDGTSEYEEGNY